MSEPEATTAVPASAILAAAGQPGVSIEEKIGLGAVNLRGQPDESGFVDAAGSALGVVPPPAPNTVADANGVEVLWLAPTEWLVRCGLAARAELQHKLIDALSDHFTAVNDVTGYYTTLTITGRGAAELLERGTPLDVHPRVFGPGQCAQTVFAQAGAILLPREAAIPSFEMIVRRSFADYVWRWLANAMRCLG